MKADVFLCKKDKALRLFMKKNYDKLTAAICQLYLLATTEEPDSVAVYEEMMTTLDERSTLNICSLVPTLHLRQVRMVRR